MNAIPVKAVLREKVLIADPHQEDPSTIGGLDYLPGSVLRGAIINHLMNINNEPNGWKDQLLDGSIRFLNCYPGHIDHGRCLPTPQSFFTEKGDPDNKIIDLAVEPPTEDAQLERLGARYCHLSDNTCFGYDVEFEARLHNQLGWSAPGSKKKTETQIYTYIGMVPDQILWGWIIAEDEGVLEAFRKAVQPESSLMLDIGRSRSVEYGLVEFFFEDISKDWKETPQINVNGPGQIIITLLSEAIIRDPKTGFYSGDLTPILGAKHSQAFSKMKFVGGFNRMWGLPTTQHHAIAAGSVFVYKHSEADINKFRNHLETGIGERTIDGFGRFAINWHIVPDYSYLSSDPEHVAYTDTVALPPDQADMMKVIMKRILLERLKYKLAEIILAVKISDPPSNTQLTRIYRVIQKLRTQSKKSIVNGDTLNINAIKVFQDNLTKNTKEHFTNAKIGSQTLFDWIRGYVDTPDEIWEKMGEVQVPIIGGVEIDKHELSNHIVLEYLGGVVKNTIKIHQQRGG